MSVKVVTHMKRQYNIQFADAYIVTTEVLQLGLLYLLQEPGL